MFHYNIITFLWSNIYGTTSNGKIQLLDLIQRLILPNIIFRKSWYVVFKK